MITINLLPEEYRKRIRPSIKILAVGYSTLAVAASLLAWWAWLVFGVSTALDTHRASLETEMAGLAPRVIYHQSLSKEAAFHASREDTLGTITSSRVLWTQVLDDLTEVVNRGHEGERHTIWFDDVTASLSDGVGQGRKSVGQLKAQGHSGSGEIDQISHFLSDLTDGEISDLPGVFGPPSAPEGRRNATDSSVVPSVDFSFPLHLELLPSSERRQGTPVAFPPETPAADAQRPGGAR
jgi:hypothetical protein